MNTLNPRWRVRWVIFAFLFAFAFVSYVQRTSIGIAAERMMPELGYSQVEIGWLLTAFLISYTALQLPGGVFGEWLGARKALIIISLVAVAAAMATPLAPLLLAGTGLFLVLLLTRFALGLAQAPLYPISTGVMESWFPVGQWGFPSGLQGAGFQLGSAATPPLIAMLMQTIGWKHALLWTSLPTLGLVALWAWYGRDTPRDHPAVRTVELDELRANGAAAAPARINRSALMRVCGNRDVLLLALSYLAMNYVFYLLTFWCFLYLVQERHFSVLESGWLASIPYVAAAIGAGVGGKLSDRLVKRWGLRVGYRALPLVALPLAGLLLFASVKAVNPYWAIVGLSLAFASIELTEGAFGAAPISVARGNSMAAMGVVNTGGNLGGIVGTPLVAALSASHAWTAAFLTGSAFAVVSGLLWLWIDASRVIGTEPVAAAPR